MFDSSGILALALRTKLKCSTVRDTRTKLKCSKSIDLNLMKYIVLDTETAGLPVRKNWNTYYNPEKFDKYYSKCRLVELGYIIYESSQTDEHVEITRYESIVIPDNFTINNSQYHNITTEKATLEGKPLVDVLNQLTTDLEDCDIIVGHNINFDIHILLAEAHRTGNIRLIDFLNTKTPFCTMVYGKFAMGVRKIPKLTELYEFLHNEPLRQDHRALSDVMATALCYHKLKGNN